MTQWAQLKGGPPARQGLERGRWYLIVDSLRAGPVRIQGPDAVGILLDQKSIRIIDHDPDAITRIHEGGLPAIAPGQRTPLLSFYGVCPKGHRIDRLTVAQDSALCSQCKTTYRIEDEEHF